MRLIFFSIQLTAAAGGKCCLWAEIIVGWRGGLATEDLGMVAAWATGVGPSGYSVTVSGDLVMFEITNQLLQFFSSSISDACLNQVQ